MTQYIYNFGNGTADGNASMKNLLGGKGANLAEMANIGLPVPSGFTITTDVCTQYYKNDHAYPTELKSQVAQSLSKIESEFGMVFGDVENPLLVSVRSGARVSMPGMMDTVLNLGLNDQTVEGLSKRSNDARFAWDSYRRFIQMYSDVVMGYDHHEFEDVIDTLKRRKDYTADTDLTADDWCAVVTEFKAIVTDFPQDAMTQLWGAIGAVFTSWQIPRAVTYRNIHDIPHDWGTAVNVQAMVFGNMGADCGTGVAFTRDPSTGENYFYGEYLINAQGEDVVAGIRTPEPLTGMKSTMPDIYNQLSDVRLKLETHYRDMQDIEFTIQQGKLYMLQTRNGKRTAKSALKIAVDMVAENLISKAEAVQRIEPESLDQLLHPTLDPNATRDVFATGLPASPGAATGAIAFTADLAEAWAKDDKPTILCRVETSPEDIHGMHAANGILTSRGGMTSHAAVVARGMGRCCVAGAGAITMDYKAKTLSVSDRIFNEGDVITLDGGTGEVMAGEIARIEPEMSDDFETLMAWADEFRTMGVRANAETELDAQTAINFGAEGIGLARTEHMFFDADRIQKVREMIFADSVKGREDTLSALEPMQKADFMSVFKVMDGLPVTVRLLDPPLHEFLPHDGKDISEFASTMGIDEKTVRDRLNQLSESNPMLGHRGCRLGITFPEIYATQVRAIIEAAIETNAKPEIMIPLIATSAELKILRDLTEKTAEAVFEKAGKRIDYLIGTMIELPRAALMAGDIAEYADFFSFGTNDLTQTAMGLSRDDAGKFLPDYIDQGIFTHDPFVRLDQSGVGRLINIACTEGRVAKPDIKLGICGEHGGDPSSIDFCQQVGLDYVSCSPYRVPIARLAAAQSAIRHGGNKVELRKVG
jgi:pyruvate,orthophosphate dikinase